MSPPRRPLYLLAALAISAIPVAVALWHNPWRGFFITPDADLIYVGEALRFAQGMPQAYFDHPGYLYVLFLSWWLKAGAALSLLPQAGIDSAVNSVDIDAYMQSMVLAGRWFSALCASSFVALFMATLRGAGLSPALAWASGLVLATSPAINIHAIIIRAELQSAMGPVFAFLALAWAARRNGWYRWVGVAVAGGLAVIGLENKVQAILPLLALPAVASFLPWAGQAASPWGPQRQELPLGLAVLAMSAPAMIMVIGTLWSGQLSPTPAGYQFMVAGWVLLGMAVWIWMNKQNMREYWRGVLALTLGASLCFYLLLIHHSTRNTEALVHFVEHMRVFSVNLNIPPDQLLVQMLTILVKFHTTKPGAVFSLLVAGTLAAAALLAKRRQWRPALLSAALVACCIAIELSFTLRSMATFYLIYILPFMIIAAAIAANSVGWQRPAMVASVVLAVHGASLSLAPELVPHQRKGNVCYQARSYLPMPLADRLNGYCGLAD